MIQVCKQDSFLLMILWRSLGAIGKLLEAFKTFVKVWISLRDKITSSFLNDYLTSFPGNRIIFYQTIKAKTRSMKVEERGLNCRPLFLSHIQNFSDSVLMNILYSFYDSTKLSSSFSTPIWMSWTFSKISSSRFSPRSIFNHLTLIYRT